MSSTTDSEYFAWAKKYFKLFGEYPGFHSDGMHTDEGMFAVIKKCVETKTPISEADFLCTYHPEKKND